MPRGKITFELGHKTITATVGLKVIESPIESSVTGIIEPKPMRYNNIIDKVLSEYPVMIEEIELATETRFNKFMNETLPRIKEESKLIEV
jgi:hypothetical protein